ncbi:MAG TPA: carboxypeptidase-like regulatory domain-containing protein [Fulvivirga sp.]|nr:carboxypeptidase-like regulatory domain-containing protein [Fulvivirga sp.]
MKKYPLAYILCFIFSWSYSQKIVLTGEVTTILGTPISEVNVVIAGKNIGTTTNDSGYFKISVEKKDSIRLVFSHVTYFEKSYWVTQNNISKPIAIQLEENTEMLDVVSIKGDREKTQGPSITKLSPKSIEDLPSPFQDFNKVLSTLPGVVSNNELSSTYSVRGGNFDENLVYVNGIPIYRPFLATSGQQEGLSFVNTDMVENVKFSAGGWQPKYGDKLSSVLNVTYSKPTSFNASANLSLLGGSIHLGGISKKERVSYSVGARHKSSKYLLNSLETKGQYLPKFTDYQSFVNINLGKPKNIERTTLGLLTSYARNRYLVEPENRETEFGNFNESLRLSVAFDGKELLEYDTYQGGLKLSHRFSNLWRSHVLVSGVYALEREYTDLEGGYKLCDVDKNLSSSNFNNCASTKGIGTNYEYGRNNLKAEILNVENQHIVLVGESTVEFGLGYSHQLIEDQLQEYSFTDSADYVTRIDAVQANNTLSSDQFTGYIQVAVPLSKNVVSTAGVRFNYWSLNRQLLTSPRWQVAIKPKGSRKLTLTGAIGLYQQPPFFRELRDFNGNVNEDLKAQRALHFIGGAEYNVTWWGRPFLVTGELYYKRMSNVVPYEVDNVKVRYYANNDAKAFAAGFDMRISGEFVEGAESWFSLGILNVREDVDGDGIGYIRRPSDQRVNLGIFFQDHLPNNPNVRVHLNFLYGSGLPFGPPGNPRSRNKFNGRAYKRVDVGFSRIIFLNKEKYAGQRKLIISAEILNLLGTKNAISYTWISDVNNNQYAVPNSLSARFLNVRVALKI